MKKSIIKPYLLLMIAMPLLIISHMSFAQVQEFSGIVNGKSYPDYLNKYLRKYEVLELNPQEISTYVQTHSLKAQLILNLSGKRFRLEIEPNDMRGKDFKAVAMTAIGATELSETFTKTYKGIENNDHSTVVRFNIDNTMFEGYIKAGNKWLFIDKLNRFVPGESDDKIVVYDNKDVIPDPNKTCGAEKLVAEQKKVEAKIQAQYLGTGNCTFMEIATEADYEYYQAFGSNAYIALQRIRDILNLVEGTYTPTFNLKFVLRYQQIWTTSSDPYSGTTLPDIMSQFMNWWNSNMGAFGRDETQMYSGRSLTTGTVGYAWIGATCNTAYYYSVCANYSPISNATVILSAHEIGHNLGATHDSYCDGGNIMCPSVQWGVPTWSTQSVSQISSYINGSGSCMGETIPADVIIGSSGTTETYLKAIASNSIEINPFGGSVLFAANGFGYLEAGVSIVLRPSSSSSPGFVAPEGSVVIMKISDVINTCDPAAITSRSSASVQNKALVENVPTNKDIQVNPNPFHSSFDVKFYLESNEDVHINIYNTLGVKVKELVQQNLSKGLNKISFNCSEYTTGIYMVVIKIGNTKTIKKIMKI